MRTFTRRLAPFGLLTVAMIAAFALAAPSLAVAAPVTGSLVGTLTLSDGTPDRLGASVAIYQKNGPNDYSMLSLANYTRSFDTSAGTFAFTNVPAGTYRVGEREIAVGLAGYSQQYVGGGASFDSTLNADVVISADATTEVTLQRGPAQVLGADSAEPDNRPSDAKPLVPGAAPVERTLASVPDIDWFSVDVKSGHTYEFDTGDSATYPNWGTGNTQLVAYLYDSDGRTVLARPDTATRLPRFSWTATADTRVYLRITGLQITLHGRPNIPNNEGYAAYTASVTETPPGSSGGTISGHVYDQTNGDVPVAGAWVSAKSPLTGATYCTATDASGTYSIPALSADTYVVSAYGVGLAQTSAVATSVAGDASVTVDVHATRSMTPSSFVGFVLMLADGGPAAGATVTISGPGGPFSAATDQYGYVDFRNLTPGPWSAHISAPGCRSIDRTVTTINSSAGVAPLVLDTMAPVGDVAGRVTAGGKPVQGVSVTVGDRPPVATDADGRYSLVGLDVGTQTLHFSRAGCQPRSLETVVSRGATTTADAVLAITKTAGVIFRDPQGSSLVYKRKKGVVTFALSASLAGAYFTLGGEKLVLQYSANGKSGWKTAWAFKTSVGGRATAKFTAKKALKRYYRWYAPDSATHTKAHSSVFRVTIK